MSGAAPFNDPVPEEHGRIARPIHCIGSPAIGLWLIDDADYEAHSEHCARLNRGEFMFVVPPLKTNGGSASPVNSIAVL